MMRTVAGVLVGLAIATAAAAQTFRGGINGIVADQTGAILPGADVGRDRRPPDPMAALPSPEQRRGGAKTTVSVSLGRVPVATRSTRRESQRSEGGGRL